MSFSVYLITNNTNGKIYVGQTCQKLDKYLRSDVTRSLKDNGDRKPKLYPAIRKYGEAAFTIKPLATAPDKFYADKLEMFFIRVMKSQEKGIGYNIAAGGGGSYGYTRVFSEEHRKKLGLVWLGRKHSEETKAKIAAGNKGKVLSEDTRKKISEARIGKPLGHFSEERRKNMADAQRGKKHSPERVEKMRQSLIAYQARKKLAEAA